MARTLTAGVVLRHPGGSRVFLPAGSELPDWAQVGDHVLSGEETVRPQPRELDSPKAPTEPASAPEQDAGVPPPKSGRGSSDAKWTAYARAHGVEVTDAMTRSEVIAACETAGVPT